MSAIDNSVSVSPAAIAGDMRTAELIRAQLYRTKYNASAWQWFSTFFE